jgi:hypothetical protein
MVAIVSFAFLKLQVEHDAECRCRDDGRDYGNQDLGPADLPTSHKYCGNRGEYGAYDWREFFKLFHH